MANLYVGKKVSICGKHGIIENIDYASKVVLIKTSKGYLATPMSNIKEEE